MNRTKLILLHGALGAKSQMRQLEQSLSDSFFVQTLEFSGHGKLDFAADFSMNQFSNELAQFIIVNALQGAHIFGYSMGGYATLNLLATNPQPIASLFTLGTKMEWTEESAKSETRQLDPEKIKEKVPQFAEALAHRHGAEKWEILLIKTAEMMLQLGAGAALTKDQLQSIKIPICMARGSEDRMVSAHETIQACDDLNARYLELKEVKHPIEQVPVDLIAQQLISWVNSLENKAHS